MFNQLRFFILLNVFFLTLLSHSMERIPNRCRMQLEELQLRRGLISELKQKTIKLSNGLLVNLFSDPNASNSAVALAVGTGGLQDHQGRSGTFHFLEHMLFILSERFPEVDDYLRYITINGGQYNGMTGLKYTVFPAEIKPDKFDELLARLSAFFSGSILPTKYIEKELSAVNQEYENNRSSDDIRLMHIIFQMIGDGHSLGRYFQGNSETLMQVSMTDLRELLNTYYVPSNFILVLSGPQSLDELNRLAKEHFGSLPKRPFRQNLFPPLKLHTPDFIPVAHVQSLKNRDLSISIVLPHDGTDITTLHSKLLAAAINQLTSGGFAHYLIQMGLVEELFASNFSLEESGDIFSIDFKLSREGIKKYEDIVRITHRFLLQLSQKPLPEDFINDLKAIRTDEYLHRPITLNYNFVLEQAITALTVPGKYTLEVGRIPLNPSPKKIQNRVRLMIDPSRWFIALSDPDFQDGDRKTQHYDISYSQENVPVNRLFLEDNLATQFALRAGNPFYTNDRVPLTVDEAPRDITLSNGSEVFYHPYDNFAQSKVGLRFRLTTPVPRNAREVALLLLSKILLDESLSEFSQLAGEAATVAGRLASPSVPGSANQLDLLVFGNRAIIPQVLKEMAKSIKQFNILTRPKVV